MAGPKGHRQHARVREKPAERYTQAPDHGALNGVLLDSDVIIEVLRGRPGILSAVGELHASMTPTYCTAISWAEIYAGLRPGEEPMTERLLESLGEVVLDSRAGRQAGRYLARFARSHALEVPDALIAAAAATSGLHLWTLNRRDYPMEDVRFFEPRLRR